ncbi:hypothetical protein [Pasteuria penetrans]|uniref:hypothetical protein n=1 Tax=Pasteuria penetrans TaxID=86005 RepID=UPI001CAA4222|nr:hypothetical protein [Pasteuria penetrans]
MQRRAGLVCYGEAAIAGPGCPLERGGFFRRLTGARAFLLWTSQHLPYQHLEGKDLW